MALKKYSNVIDIFTRLQLDINNDIEQSAENSLMEEIDLSIADEQIYNEMLKSDKDIFDYIDGVMADDEFRSLMIDCDDILFEDDPDTVSSECSSRASIISGDEDDKEGTGSTTAEDNVEVFQTILDKHRDRQRRIARNRQEFKRIINDFYINKK